MSLHASPLFPTLAFLEGLGGMEMMMVCFVAFLLFGGKNLPGFARTIGRTMREFKKASSEVQREIQRAIDEAPDDSAPARPASTLPQTPPPAVSASPSQATPAPLATAPVPPPSFPAAATPISENAAIASVYPEHPAYVPHPSASSPAPEAPAPVPAQAVESEPNNEQRSGVASVRTTIPARDL